MNEQLATFLSVVAAFWGGAVTMNVYNLNKEKERHRARRAAELNRRRK